MDKVVLTSSNACLGQMNRLYHLGFVKGNQDLSIHITSINGKIIKDYRLKIKDSKI